MPPQWIETIMGGYCEEVKGELWRGTGEEVATRMDVEEKGW